MLSSHPRAAKFSLSVFLGLVASVVLASSALAAPVTPGPAGNLFYTAPTTAPGVHGSLVRYRTAKIDISSGQPAINGWTVLYSSQSVGGKADYVTGTVLVPAAAWTGSGPRPVVDLAVGTQGLAHVSAPSLQLIAGTEYESTNMLDALEKGWAVEVTDYQGYTNGGTPDYMIGASQGHAVLDIALAAQQIPGAGISPSAQLVTWGYSQGGGASAWAAQLEPSYTPSLNYIGDASGGIPANLALVADNLNGDAFSAFLLYAIIGLEQDYPTQINLPSYENSKAPNAIKTALADTLIQATTQFALQNIDIYTNNDPATKSPWTLAELLAVPSIGAAVSAQQLGLTPITVPLYQYHASLDEIVPLAQDETLHDTYCADGVTDDWATYPGDHLLADSEALSNVITWIGNRFSGAAAPNNCSTSTN